MSAVPAATPDAPNAPTARSGLHHVEHVMGTAVSFDLRDNRAARSGLDAAITWLHHVDETFSTYRDDSPISQLGRGDITLDQVSDEIQFVLMLCERVRNETGGAFDALPSRPRTARTSIRRAW